MLYSALGSDQGSSCQRSCPRRLQPQLEASGDNGKTGKAVNTIGSRACWARPSVQDGRGPAHRIRTAFLTSSLGSRRLAVCAHRSGEREASASRTIGGEPERGKAPLGEAGRHQAALRLLRREACGFGPFRVQRGRAERWTGGRPQFTGANRPHKERPC